MHSRWTRIMSHICFPGNWLCYETWTLDRNRKKQTNACYINITYILCMYYVVAGASHNNDSVRVICVCQARYSVSGSALFKVKQQILNIKTRIPLFVTCLYPFEYPSFLLRRKTIPSPEGQSQWLRFNNPFIIRALGLFWDHRRREKQSASVIFLFTADTFQRGYSSKCNLFF